MSTPGYSNFVKKEGRRPSDVKHETNVGEGVNGPKVGGVSFLLGWRRVQANLVNVF